MDLPLPVFECDDCHIANYVKNIRHMMSGLRTRFVNRFWALNKQ